MPYFDRLFEGISALGSSPRRVANLLAEVGVGPRSLVLDLACGKGAVAIELASKLGCRVLAIDACEEFLESGRREAARRGVASLVEFRAGDVRKVRGARADAAIMLNLFGFEESTPLLRKRVKPGGVYVLDDAVEMEREPGFGPSSETRRALIAGRTPTRADARAMYRTLGDVVVREVVPRPSGVARANASLVRKLAKNARTLAKHQPRLNRVLDAFVDRQRQAGRLLTAELRPVLWSVRRAGTSKATPRRITPTSR